MASNPKPQLGFTLTVLSLLILSLSTTPTTHSLPIPNNNNNNDNDNTTVYELLPKYGLPSGLLPDSVQSFSLYSNGRFSVSLAKPCYIQFEYLVYYDREITGKLSYGSISDLKGIQVQRFFLWFDVDEIKVDLPPSDSIYFQVGLINKKLDVAQFKTVHSCRDGVSTHFGGGFRKRGLELPASLDEIEMLVTE